MKKWVTTRKALRDRMPHRVILVESTLSKQLLILSIITANCANPTAQLLHVLAAASGEMERRPIAFIAGFNVGYLFDQCLHHLRLCSLG